MKVRRGDISSNKSLYIKWCRHLDFEFVAVLLAYNVVLYLNNM